MSSTIRLTFLLLLSVVVAGSLFAQDQVDPRKWSTVDVRMTKLAAAAQSAYIPQAIPNFENPNKDYRVFNTPQGTYVAAPNIRVHPSTTFWQSEVPITRHPTNANIMYGSSNAVSFGPVFISEGMYLTSNGGTTWFGSDTTRSAPITGHSGDPGPAIGPDGRLYMSMLLSSGVGVTYSTDMGNTWAPNITLASGSQDKNHTFVDGVPGSPYNGRAYVTWSLFTAAAPPAVVSYSTNLGATWTPNQQVLPVVAGHYAQGVNGAVGPNGVAYIAWQSPITSSPFTGDFVGFAKSTDGGATWAGNSNAYDCNGIRGTLAPWGIRTNDFPSMAIDLTGGGRRGWIYIVTAEQNLAPAGSDPDIVMHRSTNGGTTWSAGIRVNQDALSNGKKQYMPWMCVDEAGGVNVVYYDNRNSAAGDSVQVVVSRSLDGGNTFTDIVVSDHKFKPAPIPGLAGGYQGDYIGITSGNGKLWPYWADNSSGIYQAWTTSITTTEGFGWAKGTITSLGTATAVSGATVDFVDPVPQVSGTSTATGLYYAGARVDTPATTRNVTMRARKFGFIDTTLAITLTRGDTLTRNFQMRPAPGGTLSVYSHTATANLRSYVEVKFGADVVVSDSTNATTGLLVVPLPVGTYSVRVDARSPYLTKNFPTVVINDGATTNVDALTASVLTFNPTAVRDTLPVGGSRTKTFTMTNSSPDTVRFRITDDNALARIQRIIDPSLPSVKRSMEQQMNPTVAKGQLNPTPGQPASPDGRGGPDAFGYSWIDSDEPGGPIFNWVEISTIGTEIVGFTPDRDDGVATIPLPWSFPFYGNIQTSLNVVTNGFMNFGATNTAFSNTAIPTTAAPNNAIYPFWDDLDLRTSGKVFYYNDVTNGRFIVQYNKAPRYGTTAVDTVTFQVILKPNGEILYQTLRVVGNALNSATIGVENAAGTVALQVAFNTAYVHNNLATRVFLPDAPWISENPTLGAIPPLGNQIVQCTFDAAGLTAGTTYNANISVDATHPDVSSPFLVPASLRVNVADSALLVLNKTSITFPGTVIGNTRRDTINARNAGALTLNVSSITTTNSRYTLSASSATLPAGANTNIIVTYTPVVPAGTDTGRVIFMSNSQGTPRKDVTLTGTAVGAPIFAARIDSLVRPAMVANSRDSIRFFVRNTGTLSGTFAARAIMFPRTAAGDKPGEPFIIPMKVSMDQPAQTPRGPLPSGSAFGPAPYRELSASETLTDRTFADVGLRAYAINLSAANNLVKFDVDVPTTLVTVGPSLQAFGGDLNNTTGAIWAIRQLAPTSLIRIDTATGAATVIGPTTQLAGHTWVGLKIDPTSGTVYAASTSGTVSTLYTINTTTGAATEVGTITNIPILIAIAIDNSGAMYGYDIDNGGVAQSRFFSINKTTGAGTLIGSTGFVGRFAQDMDFDPTTNTCYLAAYNFGATPARGELRIANVATGATTLVGPLGSGQELDCFGIAGAAGAPWLSIVPPTGTIALNDSVQFTARFDATDPSIYNNPGNYLGRIEINATNVPADTLKIPARMFVVPPAGAELTVVPDSVDFGVVALGRTDSSKTVLLKNIGASTLTITNITSSNPAFSPSVTNRTIASLDTFRLRLRFASAVPEGVKLGTLSFTSNDPTPPTVRMRGVAQGQASIAVVPDTFAFSRMAGTDTTRATFRVKNPGTDTLRYVINEGLSASAAASIIRSTTQQQSVVVAKGAIDPTPGERTSPDGRGGPDAFGYSWIDSDEPGGPAVGFVDISTTGVEITTFAPNRDDGAATIPLPFSFSFYGTSYTSINVCTNGFVNFGATATAYANAAIPNTAVPNNAIYAFWDDLNLTSSGKAFYQNDVANGRFIIQWDNVPRFNSPGDTVTFQVILKPSGEMLSQYSRMVGITNSATIGVENDAGTVALQVVFDAAYMHNNLALLITNDLLPWLSTSRTSGTIAPADSQSVELRIHPAGLANGIYNGRLLVSGNTPDIGRVKVRLQITGGTTPSLQVTAPNGGENWAVGSVQQITWNQNLVDSVKIEYSTTGRTGTYINITQGVPARPSTWIHPKGFASNPIEGSTFDSDAGTYNWTIPNTPSANCFVRIVRKSSGTPGDTSNAAFTISPAVPTGDTSWVVQPSGSTSTLYSAKAISNNVAWFAGTGGVVLRTTNGGTNWTSVGGGAIGVADIYAIEALDANTAFVTTSPGATFIYKTTNGGALWTQVYTLAGGFIDGIQMRTATEGYAVGDPVATKWVVVKTTDGGATWARMATEPPQVGTEAGWNNSFAIVGNNMWFGTNSSKVYRSTDLGLTWTSPTTPAVNGYGLAFNNATQGVLVSAAGVTNRTTDGGTTWTAGGAAGTGQGSGASGVSGAEFWGTVGTNVYYTTNGGTNWSAAAKNGYTGAVALWSLDMVSPIAGSTYGWAGGANGTIVRYRRIPPTGVANGETEIPTVFALDQNFPNPFNPSTTIKFALPEQSIVSLKIYNLLGQEIATLAEGDMPAAFHSVVWSGRNNAGSQVATGMYFYRLEATGVSGGTFNSLKKLILLK